MILSNFQFLDDNFYLVTVIKKCSDYKKIVKATKMIVISTDMVEVCIGTKRDCQCHKYLLL